MSPSPPIPPTSNCEKSTSGWRRRSRARAAGTRAAARGEAAGREAGAAAEAAERARAAHVVVLLALRLVAQDAVRLRDLLEPVGGLGIVLGGVGWYCFARRRYCFLISSWVAVGLTPSTA
jgi:hypothetical protein